MDDNICITCNIPKKVNKYICEHGKIKYRCKDCGGSSICKHNRQKSGCKDCGGSSICEHNRQKSGCKDCGGSSICEHNRQKSSCKKCGSSSICESNKEKSICKDCGGSQSCIHNKNKDYCKICGGKYLCKSFWCEKIGKPKYEGYCMQCFVNNPDNQNKLETCSYITKKNEVFYNIKETFSDFTLVSNKKMEDDCSKRRSDLLLDLGYRIIIIEVDENNYTDYDCISENKRLMEISQDLGDRQIVFIRFNPDSYTNEKGILIKSCWELDKLEVMIISKKEEWDYRMICLNERIKYWIDYSTDKTVEIVEIVKLFY